MEIRTFGGGKRLRECEMRLSGVDLGVARLVLLPIPTTRDREYITGTSARLVDIYPLCREDTLVAGYNIPSEHKLEMESRGARIFDAGLDEDFLIANAEITARGAIASLLSDTPLDITDMRVGVIGYGRIGRELCRLLLFFGASLTVYTKRDSVAADLAAAGIDSEIISAESDLSALDVAFNTAPESIISRERIAALPEKTRIIDLASGNIFEPSERLTKLASIPDAMYPISAGRLYAEAIIRAAKGESE
ncbi:MAG: hypothetical protein J6K85_00300 [Clostridia bacterium]|nr:hypothetical protein [Clostridia bacterium]